MKKLNKIIAIGLAAVTAACVSACGRNNPIGVDYEYDYTISDKKIEYTLYGFIGAFADNNKGSVLSQIEEKFNVKFRMKNGGSDESWKSTLGSIIQSDSNVPDFFTLIPDEGSFPRFAERENLVPFNGYLDKIEEENGVSHLKNLLNTEELKNSTVLNGNYYYYPQVIDVSNHVLIVRNDWMKRWAVSKGKAEDYRPQGISEYTDMFEYFATQNLDGVDSTTYGLALNKNFDFTEDFLSAFGVSPSYTKKSDGTYELSAFQPGYTEYVNWLKKCHDSGAIKQDFYLDTESDSANLFRAGRAGALVYVNNSYEQLQDYMFNNFEPTKGVEDAITWLPFPSSDNGKVKGSPIGDQYHYAGYFVSVNAEEPYRLVKILDYFASPEGQDLLSWGIKDKHYGVNAAGEKYIYCTDDNGVLLPKDQQKYIAARREEGGTVFSYNNPGAKPDEPNGSYYIGYGFSPSPYLVKDGHLVINTAYGLKGEFMREYDAYLNELKETDSVNWRLPAFLIGDDKLVTESTKVLDLARQYTEKVASGKYSQSEQETWLRDNVAKTKINQVYEYMKNNDKTK